MKKVHSLVNIFSIKPGNFRMFSLSIIFRKGLFMTPITILAFDLKITKVSTYMSS